MGIKEKPRKQDEKDLRNVRVYLTEDGRKTEEII